MRSHDNKLNRARNTWPKAIASVAILFQRAGTTVLGIACIAGLVSVSFQAGGPGPEDPPGSGIVVRTEVTALWIPRALCDVAQGEDGSSVFRSPEAMETELKRRGLNVAWYALTYRGYQVDGHYAEITQVRRISEASANIEEFHVMMATAAGRSPRYEGRDFSRARVEVIPDTLQAVDPREAITRLMAEHVVGGKISPTRSLDSTRKTG